MFKKKNTKQKNKANEPNILKIDEPVTIVGDIHG